MNYIKKFLIAMVVGSAYFLSSCSATPTRESTGEFIDGTTITAKVKTELVDKLGAKGFSIKVKTYKDHVYLTGLVDTAAIKRQAEKITNQVTGVNHVTNQLIVK